MTYVLTYRCAHNHRQTTRFAHELGREFVESVARKACSGPAIPGGLFTGSVPAVRGEEKCSQCGSAEMTWTIETDLTDHEVTV